MSINIKYFESVLNKLNFNLQNGPKKLYEKTYINHNGYVIRVDFNNEKIEYNIKNYSDGIIICNNTSNNFLKSENIVVLECIDRLLTLGYTPSSIEIEKSWSSGHGTSSCLDILVKNKNKSYMMIECKTYGNEFEKEKKKMLTEKLIGRECQPKGQLFSYYFQEKTTEYLCLYASTLENDQIIYQNAIISIDKNFNNVSNQKEFYNTWDKTFKQNGIFEKNSIPYNINCKSLLKKDLKKITDKDSNKIFNQFLEILRKNVVSDKPNAFNKILNLFICKIIDEEKSEEEELQFQWKDDSTYMSLYSNLEELYKQGMDKFLDINITDYSVEELERNLIKTDNSFKDIIKKMFQELRLQKNQEFAFKEVYNTETFEDNAKVIKDIVQLLQHFQFRYGHKQQFLGNFFELLLNTSIKQESGQFFTPVPIARFMISSLPLKETLENNIKNNAKQILPVILDYACGSGHFLTEYMDIFQNIINNFETTNLKSNIKNKINKLKQTNDKSYPQGEFEWAKECVYGIEKDYRLVKTTKISTFLNGDGEANIIHADGLDKFSSNKYKGKLKSENNKNNNFDFIIANPPYSVSSFKSTLNVDNNDFEMYSILTENSSEIECLFIERTNQLLKEGGCAAIILPSSFLSNTSIIYEQARKILLENFYIKAISKMGSNTFMATKTTTVILFIEKKEKYILNEINSLIDNFFVLKIDFNFLGKANIINKYIKHCFDDIEFFDYISYINNKPTDKIKKNDYYKNFLNKFEQSKELKKLKKLKSFKVLSEVNQKLKIDQLINSKIIDSEKTKLYYYLLTFKNTTLLISSGEKNEEKNFLGYEFSKRRGQEGIHYFKDSENNIISDLYDDESLFDSEKINKYIKNSFNNKNLPISDLFRKNLKYIDTNSLLDYEYIFSNGLSFNPNKKIIIELKNSLEIKFLKDCCDLKKGTSITEKNTIKGTIPVVAGGQAPAYYHKESNRDKNIITVSASGAYAGFVNFWRTPIFASDCTTICSIDKNILTEFIYIMLTSYQEDLYLLQKGQGQPHVYQESLGNIKISIPSLETQNIIIESFNKLSKEINHISNEIKENKRKINEIIQNIYEDNSILKSIKIIEKIAKVSRGSSPRPIRDYLTSDIKGIPWIKISDAILENKYISKTTQRIILEGELKSVSVKKGDLILSNSMTIGKPYILNINGCIHDGWLLLKDIDKGIMKEYLYYLLRSESVQTQLTDKSELNTTVKNLNIDKVNSVKIPVIDINEQKKIITQILIYEDNNNLLIEKKKNAIDKKNNLIK